MSQSLPEKKEELARRALIKNKKYKHYILGEIYNTYILFLCQVLLIVLKKYI